MSDASLACPAANIAQLRPAAPGVAEWVTTSVSEDETVADAFDNPEATEEGVWV